MSDSAKAAAGRVLLSADAQSMGDVQIVPAAVRRAHGSKYVLKTACITKGVVVHGRTVAAKALLDSRLQ